MLESQLILSWIKTGEDRGMVKKARADVLRVIAVRLEDPVPEDLVIAVEETCDAKILSEWLVAAATIPSIAKLRKAMKKS